MAAAKKIKERAQKATISKRKQVAKQAASTSLPLEKLRKKLKARQSKAHIAESRIDDSTFYTWHNTVLGATDGINQFNKWYGDICEYGKDGVTLLFPTHGKYHGPGELKGLEEIILDDQNWDYYVSTDSPIHPQGVYQGNEGKISSIYDYYEYLKEHNCVY